MKKIEKTDQELDKKFTEYGKNSLEWRRKCELLLPEIAEREIWDKLGFGSIYEYAAKKAGMSHEVVNDCLRVLKKIEALPFLKEVVEQRGVNSVKPIINLVDQSNQEFWAQKAKSMSVHTLRAYAKAIRDDSRRDVPSEKVEIKMLVSPQMADKLQKLKGDKEWEQLMDQFLKLREEKLKQEKPETVQAKSRYIPAKIKRFVIKKTEGGCAFPGCTKPGKILHHTERFAFNRFHDPAKITPLCAEHEAIAHLGLIENEEKSAENWQILRQADRNQLKFVVDQEVAQYRQFNL